MIYLQWSALSGDINNVRLAVQQAIDVEFATLPPYLYALMSIQEGKNSAAMNLVKSIALEEMVHMCLACNIMNAIGGAPAITAPTFPGPLPGDIGEDHGQPLIVHLYPFSEQAMQQGMNIEEPVDPPEFPDLTMAKLAETEERVTIGEFYARLDTALSQLPADAWQANRHQVDDRQFFQGQIFAINNYADAHRAIEEIVSEGEGSPNDKNPLDLNSELAHYYRFEELFRNQVLVKTGDDPSDYAWGEPLGVDWTAVYPAISDPESYDFSNESIDVQASQLACNVAFSEMVDHLQYAFNSNDGQLGNGVQSMFDIRMAAIKAFQTPMKSGQVAGPAFVYLPADQRIITSNKN
ncbi:MAG: hypothetical protein ACJAZT_001574 [Gammaproteobacteria bacterium]|jgi:hypothetical protein